VVLLLPLKGHTFPELTPIHSENTPLTHRRGKRKCNTVAAAVLILVSLFAIFGPYVLSGVPRERRKWEQELMRRRAAEQSRIDDWEARYIARQHEEMVRQDEWERELMQRHVVEQSRIEIWEQQLAARKRQEKIRQDEWERSQKNIRREEAHRREQERRQEEEWQLEEEKRQRLGLHWDTPIADSHCTAHNSREYWARLLNTVPFDYNWLKPCQDIPLVIHGRSLNTTRCYINKYVSSLVQPTGISDDGCH
jgi:hypothetical protein